MNNLVIQKMIGGLGNQMFQYAFIKALSLRNNLDFKLDLSPYEYYKLWPYELEVLNIEKKYADKSEIPFYERYNYGNKYLDGINNLFLRPFFAKFNKNHLIERVGVFENEFLFKKEGYFDGFFQNENYFKDFESEIRKDFTFSKPLSKKNIDLLKSLEGKNAVSVHIRRGDYLKFPKIHPICTLEYYNKSIKYIYDKVENPVFVFFSDDSERVKENFKGGNHIYVDWNKGKESWQDIALMSKCKDNIIANSSFSWRGAWLNINLNKIVIAPKLRTEVVGHNNNIVPQLWVKL